MPKKTMVYYAAAAVMTAMMVALSLSVFAQEDITRVEDSGFKSRMRPPAAFEHDRHNEKARIDDCAVCHHDYSNGKKIETSSSEGRECSECHVSNNGDPMSLANAYHLLCKGCHMKQEAGPVMCAECHRKK